MAQGVIFVTTTLTATFSDPYAADRAVARLREVGIRVAKFRSRTKKIPSEASLFVSEPYGMYFRQTPGNALMGSLPLTNGNSLMMHTPFFSDPAGAGETMISLLLDEGQAVRARAILRNCGGAEVRLRP